MEIIAAIASNPEAPPQPFVCFAVLRKSLLSGVSRLAQTKTWQRRLGCARSAAGREPGMKGGSCAGKIVVRFLFVVYSKPEGSAGRWTALGFLPKCPYLNFLQNVENLEAQGSSLAVVKTECFHSFLCFEASLF